MQFGIGNDGGPLNDVTRGLHRHSLGDIEEACHVLCLRLERVSLPDGVFGKGSGFQWAVDVSLDDERVHFVGESGPGYYDFRDIGWAERLAAIGRQERSR